MRRQPSVVRGLILAAVLAAGIPIASAQPISRENLPPSLRPWVPWVLDQVPTLGCATIQGQAVCLWPGRLELDLGPSGGSFALDLAADRAVDVRLPGSTEHWPQDVRLDGSPAPVFDKDAAPRLRVGSGRHRLAGRFAWSRLPESLAVPSEIGLVDLRLDGRTVPRPKRDDAGTLWLRAGTEAEGEGESLRLQVFRQIKDGTPLFVETRLELEVAGRAREITFPGALLPGTLPVAVTGDLPARVEKDTLRVQVRGGRYSVSVDARVEGRPTAIALPKQPPKDPWPPREVWVFAAVETERQVELSGPPPIDPSRTELPEEWRALPAFLMEPGASLSLKEVRRGEAEPPPDALTLTRELWLDPDGRGASARDRFGGTLRATTRLDLLPPGTLGRIAVDGKDQLVTAHPETKTAGVELRGSALQLEADSRLALRGAIPAVGWTTGVEQLQATLHVPPGWSLFGSTGVDRLPGTWTSRWTLLGFFFVLIVTLAVHRLFGLRPALLALAALVLTHGEADAPSAVWLSLVAAIALQRVAPAGRIQRVARLWFLVSAAVLVVVVVPFARDQVKDALFPQAGEVSGWRSAGRAPAAPARQGVPGGVVGGAVGGLPTTVPAQRAAPAAEAEDKLRSLANAADSAARLKEAVTLTAEQESVRRGRYAYNVALEQDPKAVLQTGPGVPSWAWRSYSLAWSGPVGRDHTLRLFLLSPGMNRLLTLLRLSLLAAFAYLLLTGRRPTWPVLPRSRRPEPFPVLLALLLLPTASHAEQETPSAEILQELKQRLTRVAPCQPRCFTTPSLVLRLGDSRLELSAEVHAAADGTWALPGPVGSWVPAEIRVDGAPAVAIARLAPGFLYLRLPRGVHRVEANGPVPPGDSFTLQFADPPRRARAEAPGWEVSGLRKDGPAEPSILLTRRLAARGGVASAEGRYAPWLEITRTLRFGVTWTVETRVHRVTPAGAPIALRVPLLPGEAPTGADLVVEKGEVAVSLGGDESDTTWESTLTQAPQIVLRAPEGRPWSEVWSLRCSPIWSCAATGLAPVSRRDEDVFAPRYRPWPGEAISVKLAHPQGVEGQTLTIDDVTLEDTPGRRLERVRLTATARSSREQPLVLRIPAQAEVQQLTIDGEDRPSRPEKGELRVSVPAGRHALEVRWQQSRGMGVFYGVPRVAFSSPAVNVTQQLTLPPERWLLATRGPAWGPAVLFWPYLVFLLAVAAALGRIPTSPLTSAQWVLLGLGLSVLPATGALVVAGFVFAIALRGRNAPGSPWAFDALQLLLFAWGLVSLGLLYVAIHQGLLFRPDMQVSGGGSTDELLRWYADRVTGDTPAVGVFSLPIWLYRVAMLLWALWLAASLVRGVGPSWRAFNEGGLWRPLSLPKRPKPAEPQGEDASPAELSER
ncbi:MAG TPA: hypothetical protein VJ648_10010 [Vicinamibacteria bacterium]|nr:hypothetical protein [Vicinamibacteria bacterium]